VIEGQVTRVSDRDGVLMLDFGADGHSGLLVTVTGADRRNFRAAAPDALGGRRVRVRGIVQSSNGRPMIAVANPAQIEVLN
jgi:hypothetical protein